MHAPGRRFCSDDVVRVALEWNVRIGSRHPHVERVMQKQVRQQRTDYTSLRRSCGARNNAAVLHLLRRFQPALDVEQHPRAVCMMTDSPEQQLPIDAVEEAFDIEIEHPVVTPAALTSCAHGIERRSAGPVAIGVGVEYRLQTWLQETTSDLLGDAIRYRRNAQRTRAAVRFRNVHSSHRRRKVAP